MFWAKICQSNFFLPVCFGVENCKVVGENLCAGVFTVVDDAVAVGCGGGDKKNGSLHSSRCCPSRKY